MTLLAQSTSPDGLADIREPIDIFVMPWLVLGGLVLAVLVALLLVRLHQRSKERVPVLPPEPPLVRARRKLAQLRQAADELADKALSVEASDLLRAFIEEAFKLPAGERTTEEFLPEVADDPRFNDEVRAELAEFLTQVDLVKFAAQGLSDAEREELLNAVGGFFDAAEPVLRPTEEVTA